MQLFTLRPFNQNDNASFHKGAAGNRNHNSSRGNLNWRSALVLWWTLCTKITSGWKTGLPGARRDDRSASLCKVSSLNSSLKILQQYIEIFKTLKVIL